MLSLQGIVCEHVDYVTALIDLTEVFWYYPFDE